MIDFVSAAAAESTRFAEAIDRAAATGATLDDLTVPTCSGWNMADLVWHLTEVQHFWASIVGDGLTGPADYDRPERPPTNELAATFARCSERLIEVLAATDADQPCWSWHPDGNRVGWVHRRQAHEALIHRVDADLAAGSLVAPIDPTLAADGVDELLAVMLDASSPPDWASWQPRGGTARVVAVVDGGIDRSWRVELGHIVGTDPEGTAQDMDALVVEELDPAAAAQVDASVRAPAPELDRWLWRRGQLGDAAVVEGDRAIIDALPDVSPVQ